MRSPATSPSATSPSATSPSATSPRPSTRLRRLGRLRRCTSLALAAGLVGAGLSACQANNIYRAAALRAVNATIGSSYRFTFVDQDLLGHTTITGAVDDAYRYEMLLSVDGAPQWEEIVRDDAVADYFPNPAAVRTYAGAGYAPEDDVVGVFNQLRPFLSKAQVNLLTAQYRQVVPAAQRLAPSLALAALAKGKWVVDPTGAPAVPTLSQAATALRTDPFYEAQILLAQAQADLQQATPAEVVLYRANSTSPAYKPGDNPFPPPGPGVQEYEVTEPLLPSAQLAGPNGLPPPPGNSSFRKLAVYVSHGRVVAIRLDYDVLDRLTQVAQLYHIPLHINRSDGVQFEEEIGQLLVDSLQGRTQDPFRVHEETMLFTYPSTPPPITLPSPAVHASLSVIPGQGVNPAAVS